MCGVFGAIGDNITKELIKDGLLFTQERGKDATGLYQPKAGILKSNDKAEEFIKSPLMNQVVEDKMVLGHCRQWTAGKPCNNENNHPFEGSQYILVHNGTCPFMDKIEDYPYKGECDSEILLSHIETYGFIGGLSLLRGTASLLMAPTDRSHKMWIWRDTSPLFVGYNEEKNLIVVTSTLNIMKSVVNESLLNGLILDTKGWKFSSVEEYELWELGIKEDGKVTAHLVDTIEPKLGGYYSTYTTNTYDNYLARQRRLAAKEKEEDKNKWGNGVDTTKLLEEKNTTIINNNTQTVTQDTDSYPPPTYNPTCPDFGYDLIECKDCAFDLSCRKIGLDNATNMATLSSEEIRSKLGCNGVQIIGEVGCRTCPIRRLCIYDIEDNWDETNINGLLPAPKEYPAFEYGTGAF